MTTCDGQGKSGPVLTSVALGAMQDEFRKIGKALSVSLPKPTLPKSTVPTPKAPAAPRGQKAEYIEGHSRTTNPPAARGTLFRGDT